MIDYPENIRNSRLSIYDGVSPTDIRLFIPNDVLESILENSLVGSSLAGLPLRTRSKVVKEQVCIALGYPVPMSFVRTQPRFWGQNFDVYTQKSFNVQIWNEDIDAERRYVFLQVSENDTITRVRVINGQQLSYYDRTGALTHKFQAHMLQGRASFSSEHDTSSVEEWIDNNASFRINKSPTELPDQRSLLPIIGIFHRLLPLVGNTLDYVDAVQERNRGAELHAMICSLLGYSYFDDDGTYPDITNQLLEIKLQTSPTIDLGLHSPEDGKLIFTVNGKGFYSEDVRYAIIDAIVIGKRVKINNIYVVTGHEFSSYFPMFRGKGMNTKIQIHLPLDFFD